MKLTPKQQKALINLEKFIPSWVKWDDSMTKYYAIELQIPESSDGEEAERAFFNKTERGIEPTKIKDVKRYAQLIWAQRWMATHIKMWQEGVKDGTFYPCMELPPEHCELLGVKPLYTQWDYENDCAIY